MIWGFVFVSFFRIWSWNKSCYTPTHTPILCANWSSTKLCGITFRFQIHLCSTHHGVSQLPVSFATAVLSEIRALSMRNEERFRSEFLARRNSPTKILCSLWPKFSCSTRLYVPSPVKGDPKMSLALERPRLAPVQPWGCSKARDIFGTLRPSPENTTCSFPYRFRGNPGTRALYQAIGIPSQK